jgi:hypothetical protein
LIWQKTYDLATLAMQDTLLPGKALLNGINILNLNMKMTLKCKINIFRQYLGYYICPLNPSAGLPSLMRLSLKP